jgi:glyoxylate/hydroxypyruvate reductase A
VFPAEPLPPDSPLWDHPDIIITPHNAAESDPRAITANVLEQIARFERGEALEHVIDRGRGY